MSNPMTGTRELRFTDFTGGTDDCLDYASHTDGASAYYAPVGCRAQVWKDGLVYNYVVEDTGATPDGRNVVISVSGGYSGSLRWTLYQSVTIIIRSIQIVKQDVALTTGDGKFSWFIPQEFDGFEITALHAAVNTPSTSGLPSFAVYNVTQSVDVLSQNITIDVGEKTSYTATTAPVINTSNNSVSTGDELRFDCDAAGTGTLGLQAIITLQ